MSLSGIGSRFVKARARCGGQGGIVVLVEIKVDGDVEGDACGLCHSTPFLLHSFAI